MPGGGGGGGAMMQMLRRAGAAAEQALQSPVAQNLAAMSPLSTLRSGGGSAAATAQQAALTHSAAARKSMTQDELVERAAALSSELKELDARLARSKQTLDDAQRDQSDLIRMICSLIGLKAADVQKKIVSHRTGTLLALKKKCGDHGGARAKREAKRSKEIAALEGELERLASTHRAAVAGLAAQLSSRSGVDGDGKDEATADGAGGALQRSTADARAFLRRKIELDERIRIDDKAAQDEALAELATRRAKTELRLRALHCAEQADEAAIVEAVARRETKLRESEARAADLAALEAEASESAAEREVALRALLDSFRASQMELATARETAAREAAELDAAKRVADEVELLRSKLASGKELGEEEAARERTEALRAQLAATCSDTDAEVLEAVDQQLAAERALHDTLRADLHRAEQTDATAQERLDVVDKAMDAAALQVRIARARLPRPRLPRPRPRPRRHTHRLTPQPAPFLLSASATHKLDEVMNDIDEASARLSRSVAAEAAVAAQLAALGKSQRARSVASETARERIAALRAEVVRGETRREQLAAAKRDTAARSALLAEENETLEAALEAEAVGRGAQLDMLTRELSEQGARMKTTLFSRVSVLEQMRATARGLELSVRFGAPGERGIIDSARSQAGRSPAMRKATHALERDQALLERATRERKKVEAAMKEAVVELAAGDAASDSSASGSAGDGARAGGAAESGDAAADHRVMYHYLKQVMYRYLTFADTEQGVIQRASLKPMILELAGLDRSGIPKPK